MSATAHSRTRLKNVSYSKWGYIFITPFFAAFAVFTLIPLFSTIYNSFFENYMVGLDQVGPRFVGFANYVEIFTKGDIGKYALNTVILWMGGFIPQILISLLLAAWFTDLRLNLKCLSFFKTVIYMPNVIMAAAMAMLFFTLFSESGPVNQLLLNFGLIEKPLVFLTLTNPTRGLIAAMNFIMWFGNTTILLMAGILGIDTSLFESAQIDGAKPFKIFTKITLPLLAPIMTFVLITSLIGGIQMFDVPQVLTNGQGTPDRNSMTLVMYLNKHLFSKNYGLGGAVSVVLFIITALLSYAVFRAVGGRKKRREA
jgi:cellobiose transport system permease protein